MHTMLKNMIEANNVYMDEMNTIPLFTNLWITMLHNQEYTRSGNAPLGNSCLLCDLKSYNLSQHFQRHQNTSLTHTQEIHGAHFWPAFSKQFSGWRLWWGLCSLNYTAFSYKTRKVQHFSVECKLERSFKMLPNPARTHTHSHIHSHAHLIIQNTSVQSTHPDHLLHLLHILFDSNSVKSWGAPFCWTFDCSPLKFKPVFVFTLDLLI